MGMIFRGSNIYIFLRQKIKFSILCFVLTFETKLEEDFLVLTLCLGTFRILSLKSKSSFSETILCDLSNTVESHHSALSARSKAEKLTCIFFSP